MAQRIFLIFFMKLGDYEGKKVTEPKKNLDLEIFAKSSANWPKIKHFDIFLKTGSNSFIGFWPSISGKLIFQKNLLFRDIWPQNRQKIAQIVVFGHFVINFASLVFLDFEHNDRWAWCLAVFLQFAGSVNVFLLILFFYYCYYCILLLCVCACVCVWKLKRKC